MSCKDKKQISKALKKVAFFSMKAESVIDASDDSEGMQEAGNFNLGAINKSIKKGGLRKNPKSFNFSQKQFNDLIENNGEAQD